MTNSHIESHNSWPQKLSSHYLNKIPVKRCISITTSLVWTVDGDVVYHTRSLILISHNWF